MTPVKLELECTGTEDFTSVLRGLVKISLVLDHLRSSKISFADFIFYSEIFLKKYPKVLINILCLKKQLDSYFVVLFQV